MNTSTKITDIEKTLALAKAEASLKLAVKSGAELYRSGPIGSPADWVAQTARDAERVGAAHKNRGAAVGAVAKLPKARREFAAATIAAAERCATQALRLGGDYSGDTTTHAGWGDAALAQTVTSYGDRYSRACKYSKTDATHYVTLCAAGAVGLYGLPEVVELSRAEGLPLISLDEFSGAAVWVVAKNKSIHSVSGWVAWSGDRRVVYHSVKSAEDAKTGLARKLAIAKRAAILDAERGKIERRARLVARLCGGLVATVADAKRLGYCEPGIEAYQSRHGFGDAVPLPQLVRSGDNMAISLALEIARKCSRKMALASASNN